MALDMRRLLEEQAKIYFIGIKGTGMSALAELLTQAGAAVSGADVETVFYTDAVLQSAGIPYYNGFAAANVPTDAALVVYSDAYTADTNIEMRTAARLGLPMAKYTDALGAYSALFDSSGIAGVHGKTTTTALVGCIAKGIGLSAQILAGSAVSAFGNRSTLTLGQRYFIAETCEYRRHFMAFHPRHIILTAVESDHEDFYPTYKSIRDAFVDYVCLLPTSGEMIYCADNPGATEVATIAHNQRNDITLTPYGYSAAGDYQIVESRVTEGRNEWTLAGFPSQRFALRVPGDHNILNATAALALARALAGQAFDAHATLDAVSNALLAYAGCKRRCEIVGEADGILFIDDYGHHPTAIKATLAGLKAFYPGRRLVVSFMPHTYTRTAALFDDFAGAFGDADVLFLHKIYPSARETYTGGVTGRTLAEATQAHHPATRYVEEPLDAVPLVRDTLRPGDIFLTLGAGDNWRLGERVLEEFQRGV
jgi:UDP-N-acetylmuramate--alanine ligase